MVAICDAVRQREREARCVTKLTGGSASDGEGRVKLGADEPVGTDDDAERSSSEEDGEEALPPSETEGEERSDGAPGRALNEI